MIRSTVFKICLVGIFLLQGSLVRANQKGISNYRLFFAEARYGGEELIIIRKFEQSGQTFYVAVNPDNLNTRLIQDKGTTIRPSNWKDIQRDYQNTAYIKAIQTARKQSFSTQDAGIIHGFPKEKGITLTIDLCPSHKPLDRVIFTTLISEFRAIEKPVPIALSITGRFMLTHADDLTWLKKLVNAHKISITWINHTYNHHYNPRLPLRENFLLEPNTDLNFEILGTEMALLQQGLLFSAFFRFPGLVSDQRMVKTVTCYGLIPVGSDAWLAKGQQASAGSIVLIHGNGNEPMGIKDFIHLLHTEQSAVLNKEWLLYDLRESIENEFNGD